MRKVFSRIVPYLLVMPALLLIATLIIGLSSIFAWSFSDSGTTNSALNFAHYESLALRPSYRYYFGYSLSLATVATVVALVLGYPVAYYMELRASQRQRRAILACLIAVFLSDYVLRMFGLILILGRSGLVNSLATSFDLTDAPLRLMYNEFGVLVGLISGVLPFMILSLNGVIARLDHNLRDASALLGAGPARTFLSITLPLTIPGIIAGTMLSFLLSLNSFVTPVLLGGGRVDMIAVFIFDQAISLANMALGSAASAVLFVLSAIVVIAFGILGDRHVRRFQ